MYVSPISVISVSLHAENKGKYADGAEVCVFMEQSLQRYTLEHSESPLRKQGKLSTTCTFFPMWLGFNLHLEEM